jgi:uncharacterized protein (DUF1800 family)
VAATADIVHLLRRTEFVARPARVAELSARSIPEAVDDVLDIARNGTVEVPADLRTFRPDDNWGQYEAAVAWWMGRMVNAPRPIQERMTLFWHGHFTSAWWQGLSRADSMTQQNQLYRQLALGNYRDLAQRMSIEPAMLVYLDNNGNRVGSPNQNFARELLELFLLGVGNYTEGDVEAAARAWTGHNAEWPDYEYRFVAELHDHEPKSFLGTTRNWDGPEIIDHVLLHHSVARVTAARFIARKLWVFFASPSPPAGVIEHLAEVFLASGLDLRSLLRALLVHPEFYSVTSRQGLVRSPVEYVVAIAAHTGMPVAESGFPWLGERMGQSLFNPPNVSGWRPNAAWLHSAALSARAKMARHATWGLRHNDGFAHLNDLPVPDAVTAAAQHFGISDLSARTRAALESAHQAERQAQAWQSWWAPTNLLTMTMLAPEFHLA